jgi:hypothetical protein
MTSKAGGTVKHRPTIYQSGKCMQSTIKARLPAGDVYYLVLSNQVSKCQFQGRLDRRDASLPSLTAPLLRPREHKEPSVMELAGMTIESRKVGR